MYCTHVYTVFTENSYLNSLHRTVITLAKIYMYYFMQLMCNVLSKKDREAVHTDESLTVNLQMLLEYDNY